ncbi:helix-turn-helix transcriptional regulator [Chryseosolibacter indicus]|uniref:Helix-turn-helix domain-containing protein n=1 Tax=Chryseosolibacter indicus TaxID=2782351 RepID=A0ABS5VWR6_9BACT|nr:helix-turn-helix transcriptional regulator [Chryseosolibacter indicus]MBT1704446.1 helix-turn-helix domain-containing protein [Chryseosolibacter indicus]
MKAKQSGSVEQDPEEVIKKVGKKMAMLRKKLGYKNSDDFAYDNDVNRSQYGKYEAGSQDLRLKSLIKMVNKLGMTIEEFFGKGL